MRDLISLLLHSKRHIVDVFVSFVDLSAQKETPHIYTGIYVYGFSIKCKSITNFHQV